jgi:hypothetical protein
MVKVRNITFWITTLCSAIDGCQTTKHYTAKDHSPNSHQYDNIGSHSFLHQAGLKVLMSMKSTVFWDITPCSSDKVRCSQEHVASVFKVKE